MGYGIWEKWLGIIFNMFRMTQNCSKCIQRVKKVKNAPIFSKHAEERGRLELQLLFQFVAAVKVKVVVTDIYIMCCTYITLTEF